MASAPSSEIEIRYGVLDPPIIEQRDVTIRERTSIHPIDPEPKPLECSGLVAIGDVLLATSDRHGHVVFSLPLELDGPDVTIGLPETREIIGTEKLLLSDAEAVTARRALGGGWSVYIMCSMSNDPAGVARSSRQHMARLRVESDGRIVPSQVSVLSTDGVRAALQGHFEALAVAPYASFYSARGENTERWGSIEGVTWTPDNELMLCGMRNPVAGDDAILFALDGVETAFAAMDPTRFQITDLFRLDLGGRGVTDLAWDPVTDGFLVAAALSNGPKIDPNQRYPLDDLSSSLFWWSGVKSEAPILVATLVDLNIDAVCRIGETSLIAIASDEGDVSEERQGRQSVVTLLHFDRARLAAIRAGAEAQP